MSQVDLQRLARELALDPEGVRRTVELLDGGNTVPFITRYRQDQTGGLDEQQIERIRDQVRAARQLEDRKQTILRSLESQNKLDDALRKLIESSTTLKRLDDLYLPFKPKKQSLASRAREQGLEPLATEILAAAETASDLDARAKDFVTPASELPQEQTPETPATETPATETPATEAPVTEAPVTETPAPAPPAEVAATEPTSEEVAPEEPATTEAGAEAASTGETATAEPTPPEPAKKEDDKSVADVASALVGAGHILAEQFAENVEFRQRARKAFRKSGKLVAKQVEGAAAKKLQVYKDFLDYQEPLTKVPAHRVLAINRGERAKLLRVGVECDAAAVERLGIELLVPADHPHTTYLAGVVRDAINRLLLPSLEREARRELTEHAESHSVEVFARNLKQLLLQPPLPNRRVLAIDPGYKNGCKLAALDEFGGIITTGLVHLVGSDDAIAKTREELARLVNEHQLNLIAIGNGKACRPTEELVAEMLGEEFKEKDLAYVIVNEAGASVYSTSTIGREELPDYEAMQRSAISIGRRMQDPLSELVKIDPASIGVGLYQHDARAKPMRDSLNEVVQSCVSFVGVDVNSASAALLRYVSGLNQLTARRITEHRTEKGPFRNRQQLLEVSGFGDGTFLQAAGFLKVDGGENPLDATWVHPESYPVAEKLLAILGLSVDVFSSADGAQQFKASLAKWDNHGNEPAETTDAKPAAEATEEVVPRDRAELAAELEVGRFTLDQLVDALIRPGRDLREDLPPPIFRHDVVKFEDLHEGIELRGTVLNVVDFGVFVDVGLSDSGLVHVSRMSNDYVKDPHGVVSVGDQVQVWVATIDKERRRVALTMIEPGTERAPVKRQRGRRPAKKEAAANSDGAPAANADGQTATPAHSRNRSNSSGEGRSGRRPRSGDKRSGDKRRDNKRGGGRQASGPRQPAGPRVYEYKAKEPPKPISKEMQEGAEAMRSFSDLLQFVKTKSDDGSDESNKK